MEKIINRSAKAQAEKAVEARASATLRRQRTAAQERVLRALFETKRRLEREGTSLWSVRSSQDRRRRPIAWISVRDAAWLVEDGALVAAEDGRLKLAAAERARLTALPADPKAWMAAGLPRARATGETFVTMALKAQQGEPSPLSLRQTAAGLRLIADAERAASSPSLSMNWDAVPASTGPRGGGEPVGGGSARARLAKLSEAVGEPAFAMAMAACVEGRSVRWLEDRFGLVRRRGAQALARALERLADAYDGRKAVKNPAFA